MIHRAHKGKSGPRSNMYSKVRFSNWSRFNPYYEEAKRVARDSRPVARLSPGDGDACSVYVAPLDPRFVRPASLEDVMGTLASVPVEFLMGLESVLILGGTGKQDRQAEGRRFCYGCYWTSPKWICLYAFPRRLLTWRLRESVRPSDLQPYRRAGVKCQSDRGRWTLEYDDESLRRFYLDTVLLHEIGHHVDRHNDPRPTAESERFAVWFAQKAARDRRSANPTSP